VDHRPVMLVTGGSSGIGAATARQAIDAGHRVVIGARSEQPLQRLAEQLGGREHAVARRCDVTDWDHVQGLVETGLEAFGRIDVVFANAGFGARRGFLEETVDHWRSMVLTNVLGVALTIRATLPHLLERGTGHVVLTSTIAGRRALAGSLYSSTKWAVTGMGESLRRELREIHQNTGIRVTLIEPGGVDTPFFDQRQEGRLHADDVARTVLWAISQPAHVDIGEVLVLSSAQSI
jgi:NADP-dependent 3-hydroxy acid dehydrogenase YdfG